ncbi:hypothetical protein D9M72_335600 [compost metagenome]
MRSTIERPSPSPEAVRAPSSSRANSLKTVRNFDDGMPMPESSTSIVAIAPCLRTPTSTLPVSVYLIALETRFCTTRRKRFGSLRTTSEVGMTTRSRSLARAIGAKSVSMRRSRSLSGTDCSRGFIAPVSRREISSTAPRMASTDSSEESMFSTSVLLSESPSRSTSEDE